MKKIYNPTKRKRILIVSDDQVVASIYQNKLENARYDVKIACESRHALRMVEMEPFDLAILDLSPLEMNWVEILKAIPPQSGSEGIPIIVLMNFYLPELVRAASQAGTTRCLRKCDCTPNQVLAIVREVFATGAIAGKLSSNVESASASVVALSLHNGRAIQSAGSAALEIEYQAKPLANFLAHAPPTLRRLRTGHHVLVKSEEENLRLVQLLEMLQQARLLAGAAAIAGFRKVAQLASALEALLFQLHSKPASITPSAIRTVAQAVDLLGSLCDPATGPQSEMSVSPAILVVDDEVISREAICSAIERAAFGTVSLDDPMKAEDLLKQTRFDLIFLDVEMPGQSGLDLCASIRTMATNRATPVVFVTAHSDFENRAQSVLSGGNDFIAKPFLPVELVVKTLIWTFKDKVRPVSAPDLKSSVDKEIEQQQAFEVAPDRAPHVCANGKDQTLAVPVGKS